MKFLYIFPHPDDESFGPAAIMHAQLRAGHEVHLLTLTKGGATRQRYRLGLSVEEMGELRYREMLAVQDVLRLSSMTVLDYPDSGLKDMDPRVLEAVVEKHIHSLQPDILVTYAVHGISGFHDHLVTHAVVKRVYLELRDAMNAAPRRLALLTLPDSGEPTFEHGRIRLRHSTPEEIDCIIALTDEDVHAMITALACYETYQDTIQASGVIEKVGDRLYFELFDEAFEPPLHSLEEQLLA